MRNPFKKKSFVEKHVTWENAGRVAGAACTAITVYPCAKEAYRDAKSAFNSTAETVKNKFKKSQAGKPAVTETPQTPAQ